MINATHATIIIWQSDPMFPDIMFSHPGKSLYARNCVWQYTLYKIREITWAQWDLSIDATNPWTSIKLPFPQPGVPTNHLHQHQFQILLLRLIFDQCVLWQYNKYLARCTCLISWSPNSTYLHLDFYLLSWQWWPLWSTGTLYQWSLQPEKASQDLCLFKISMSCI